jgi:hypothetical protein
VGKPTASCNSTNSVGQLEGPADRASRHGDNDCLRALMPQKKKIKKKFKKKKKFK